MQYLWSLWSRYRWFKLGVLVAALLQQSGLAQFGSGVAICTAPTPPTISATPTVVTTCTNAGIQAALDGAGRNEDIHVRFDCGGPATINISTPLVLNDQNLLLDGEGNITLDGGGTSRILEDPNVGIQADGHYANDIILQDIRIVNAVAPAAVGNQDGNARGGALNVGGPGTRLYVVDSTFENNRTTSPTDEDNQGGAVFVANAFETVILGSSFTNNRAGNGGAFGGIATGLLVYNSTFTNNQATDSTSGGIVRGHGGALHLDGVTNGFNPSSNRTVDICGSSFSGNTAVRGGGAIKTTVSDGQGTKLTISESSFVNNRLEGVPPAEGHGGALYHIEDDNVGATGEDNLEIRNSTFENNYAYRQGGAAWILVQGNGRIVNSTFAANRASETGTNRVGQGGAVIISQGTIPIESSTFAGNFATFQGGAVFAGNSAAVTLTNSLFANNVLDPSHTNPATSDFQGYHTNRTLTGNGNLQFPRLKPFGVGNDVNNIITSPDPLFDDPLLASLADNGGNTRTFALGDGSPAINAGIAGCPATDQRGQARVDACDIGAFEFQGAATAPTISGTPATTINVGEAYSFTPTASDPNGDSLSFEIVNQPIWASFDGTTGELSGTPTTTDVGTTVGIVISVSDGVESASLAAFDLEVVDANALTISGMPAAGVVVGDSYSFTPTVSNPSGATLTFSIVNQPTWASFDDTTGELSGTPTETDIGITTGIEIRVTDGTDTLVLAPFSVTVTSSITTATLTFSVGLETPTSITPVPSGTNVPVLQVVATAANDTATLTSLTVMLEQPDQTLGPVTAINLYEDTNANGRVDLNETQLASVPAPTPTTLTTPVTLTLTNPLEVTVATPATLLITYDLGEF